MAHQKNHYLGCLGSETLENIETHATNYKKHTKCKYKSNSFQNWGSALATCSTFQRHQQASLKARMPL